MLLQQRMWELELGKLISTRRWSDFKNTPEIDSYVFCDEKECSIRDVYLSLAQNLDFVLQNARLSFFFKADLHDT